MPVAPVAIALALTALTAARTAAAQPLGFARLPAHVLDVEPPSARILGAPGQMTVLSRPCRTTPTAETRRRIVNVAIQEWAFFGLRVAEPTDDGDGDAGRLEAAPREVTAPDRPRGRRPRLPPAEAARVAASIAGYWAVTPQGPWIVARQNDRWKEPEGIGARWNAPWSAAFISWVMCEAGVGESAQFQRAIAHHTYIDQAIRARDGRAPQSAFVAHDVGEITLVPGDLLCSSRRPAYRTIAERRAQVGVGARSHCDVVVTVDEARARILVIGGNVRGVVSLKVFPALQRPGGVLRPQTGDAERPMFAHLKLRSAAVEGTALEHSPTITAVVCGGRPGTPIGVTVPLVAASALAGVRC